MIIRISFSDPGDLRLGEGYGNHLRQLIFFLIFQNGRRRGVVGMVEQFDPTVVVFYQCGATLYPISGIKVSRAIQGVNRWRVDVAAEHGIDIPIPGIPNHGFLKMSDETHPIFDLGFHVGAQRPIPETHPAADKVHNPVELH